MDPNELRIKVPVGMNLKLTRRKTNTSTTILLTVNKDTKVVEIADDPVPPVPQPESAEGTRGTRVVDAKGRVFEIEPGTNNVLVNGVSAAGGVSKQLLYFKKRVYSDTFHGHGWWYIAEDLSKWIQHGMADPSEPAPMPTPDPVPVPTPTPPPPPPPPPPPNPAPSEGFVFRGSIDAGSNKLKIG